MSEPLLGVTFDWWGTLYRHRDAGRRRVERIAQVLRQHGHPVTEDAVDSAYWAGADVFDAEWRAGRAYTPERWLSQVLDQLEADLPEGERDLLQSFMEEAILTHPPELVAGARDLLLDLADAGVKLGIVSDTGLTVGRVMRTILAGDGIEGCFQGFAFSDEVGFCKPNRLAFERALGEMGVAPARAVHVGDLPQTDIRGAKALGMRAVLVTGVSDTSDEGTADAVVTDFDELRGLFQDWGLL